MLQIEKSDEQQIRIPVKKMAFYLNHSMNSASHLSNTEPRNYTSLKKKIHKNPMGIWPTVINCDSITEKISQFVDQWLQLYVTVFGKTRHMG